MKVKLLVVDDEILQLNLIGKVIQRYRPQYEVITSPSPLEALEILKTEGCDALITDVKMPGMDGIELIRNARSLDISPLEIIILSGFDDFKYARSAISFEVLEYLLKPIDAQSLQRVLGKLEEKLCKNKTQVQLQSDYEQMIRQECATALFKRACGLMLTAQERARLSADMNGRLRMILMEACGGGGPYRPIKPNLCGGACDGLLLAV